RHAIEAGGRGSRQHRCTVFLHEALQYQVVAVPALQAGNKFGAHGIRVSAAHVITFQQHIILCPSLSKRARASSPAPIATATITTSASSRPTVLATGAPRHLKP